MRVLIADDEPDVRMGLKTIIDWSKLGFQVCGEAVNGEDCLQKMLSLHPDLVLLDIRMPKMHGLECAQAARAKGWNGNIIILSGYSDFQYAQSAIRCGVESYLLKPIDEDELIESVNRIKEKIEHQHRQSQSMNLCRDKARNAVFLDILTGKVVFEGTSPHFDLQTADLYGLGLNADCYQIVMPEKKTNPAVITSPSLLMLTKLIQRGSQMVEYINAHEKTVYLLKGNDIIRKFEKELQQAPGTDLFFAVGRVVLTPNDISLSFQDAEMIFAKKFFCDRDQSFIRYQDTQKESTSCSISDANIQDYVKKLYSCLQAGNSEAVCKMLEELQTLLNEMDALPDYVTNLLINIYIQVKHTVFENYSNLNLDIEKDADIISTIYKMQRLYKAMDYLKDGLLQMANAIDGVEGNRVFDKMKYYIEKNYFRNLKLEMLAKSFGYNSAYLGKLFKNQIGESFNSYLDRVRIEKAKELLGQDNLKVYAISEKVGYDNVDYFCIKFHRYVGQSPSNYRKNLPENEIIAN